LLNVNKVKLKTVNSISGGKTSAYIAANYKADYNVFALVTTNNKKCLYPDVKLRQIVSDKLGREFIGTLEDDIIINTILDLEQFIGKEINWVTGDTFEDIIINKSNYLPNKVARYCTTELKTMPILHWMYETLKEPCYMNFGYRANETKRAKNMLEKVDKQGFTTVKATFMKLKDGRNSWATYKYCKPLFPLIDDKIFKDKIENYWSDKPVRFARHNNCVGCWWRSEIFLKKMFEKHENKMNWFVEQEEKSKGTFKTGVTYKQIKNHKLQIELFDDDFNECDTGYCGL
jgi:hypothetical protein|tara:strand:- start:1109 stop:1972 length:864 start_codon:yes stop_codon:yes gene_type:complete